MKLYCNLIFKLLTIQKILFKFPLLDLLCNYKGILIKSVEGGSNVQMEISFYRRDYPLYQLSYCKAGGCSLRASSQKYDELETQATVSGVEVVGHVLRKIIHAVLPSANYFIYVSLANLGT